MMDSGELNRRAIDLAERGALPDPLIRAGIRALLRRRLDSIDGGDCEARQQRVRDFIDAMDGGPIAVNTADANRQHYELPPEFFRTVLGRRRKYSCCWWDPQAHDLDEAEAAMLDLTCRRAGIADGARVLELGCGWGSLSLWIAARHPNCRVLAVSNSHAQRRFIEGMVEQQGLQNLEVVTCDMNDFRADRRFDRVVSVEMFEHMRNHRALLRRIADWLEPGGTLFLHIFCHREVPYFFEDRDASDWMSRTFFTGGMMPCDALPLYFQEQLAIEGHWRINGRHYERTLNAWLDRADARKDQLAHLFRQTYGARDAARWWQRWRIFFMACAELFGFGGGNEWFVSHYRYGKPSD